MGPKVSENTKKAHKGVMLSVKLDVIKYIWYELVDDFLGLGSFKNFFNICQW